jgi:tetratricopeptide (TPR) repeat protein
LRTRHLIRGAVGASLFIMLVLSSCATGGIDPEREAEYRSVMSRADQAMEVGQFARAAELLEPEIELLFERGDYPAYARPLVLMEWMLSSAYAEQGDLNRAADAIASSIGHHRDAEDESDQLLLELLFSQGKILGESGRYPESVETFTEAVDLIREQGWEDANYLQLADAYGYIAVSQRFMGEYDASVDNRMEAIDILLANGVEDNAWVLGRNYQLLAEVRYDQAKFEEGIEASAEAIRYHEMHGQDAYNLAESYYFNGINLMESRGVVAARPSFIRAVELYQSIEQPNSMYAGIAAYNLAWGYEQDDQSDRSGEYYQLAAYHYERVLNMLSQRAQAFPRDRRRPAYSGDAPAHRRRL